jgi:hypothetical protein
LFEEDVYPTWEDPVNELGADFSIKQGFDLDKLARVWELLVPTLIGESLAFSKALTGARIVDKKHS